MSLLATPWTAAHQAPPSMGFSRQEYWSGVPLPSPVYSVRECSNFIILHVAVQSSPHHLLKTLHFSIIYSYLLCQRLGDHRCVGLSLGFLSGFTDLYFCFCASTMMTVGSYYSLKSGSLVLPPPFFFLKIALPIWGILILWKMPLVI